MGCIRVGKGPVLVFVHGFLSGLAYWEKQIESLSKHFEVIAMDLPGYGGKTDKTGLDSVVGFATYILEELDKLGIDNFHLVGHSMGGMIAQQIALQSPTRVKRLVLYGTGPIGELPGRFETLQLSKEKVQQNGTEHTKQYTVASWFKKGAADPNFAPGMLMAKEVSLPSYINALSAMASWSAMGKLGQIQAKTLVIWGDMDRSYIWQQPHTLWQEIQQASLAVMPGCSHNAHLENPQLFNLLVSDFLSES
ncbi:MAG: alpha/beta hydrolase [Oceanospirillaceae bacterium]